MIDFIFQTVFFGFSIWSLFFLIFGSRKWSKKVELQFTDQVAVCLAIATGIIHLGIALYSIEGLERVFGRYWFGFWIYPITYFFLFQLLWTSRFKNSKIYRLSLALWTILVVNLNNFITLITSFERDYGESSERLALFSHLLMNWLLYIILFCGILTLVTVFRYLVHKSRIDDALDAGI